MIGNKKSPFNVLVTYTLYIQRCYWITKGDEKERTMLSRQGLLAFIGGKWSTARTQALKKMEQEGIIESHKVYGRIYYCLTSRTASEIMQSRFGKEQKHIEFSQNEVPF